MKYEFYIGIDVSKDTLDVAVLNEQHKEEVNHLKIRNNDDGIHEMITWLNEKQQDFSIARTLFCMEATGLYCYPLLQFLYQNNAAIWVENAVQIKRSIGVLRGKNDKVDAIRIAQYAFKNIDRVRFWEPKREVVDMLKHLAALRERLVETKKRLITPVEEFRKVGNEQMAKMLGKSMHKSIQAIEKDIEGIENQMKKIISDDDQLRKLYSLVTSVVGIGFVTATNLIIHTNEFTLIKDARKLACYCGIAPFEHSSGSSVRGRTRVSSMANKKLKTNLHMASLTGMKLDEGLRNYYERKVAEGKNKMSVLNAIKNKLVARIIAVVNRGTPYQKKYFQNDLVLS